MTVKVNFSSYKFIPNNMLNYRHLILSLCLMLIASSTLSSEKILDLYDFNSLEKAGKWMVVNDGVMGGVSQSQLSLGGEGSLLFEGSVSLDYGGGFASVRSIVNQLDAHEYQGISIKIKGDGNKYQLRLRQTSKADGVAFFQHFQTEMGQWKEIFLAFNDFKATYRGRLLPDHPDLDTSRISQIGLMISDKQKGAFRLEINRIALFKE
jgi:hypothetical protein